ncbi:hypothetical protein U9M48_027588 [Paspalum notatum var. saurae]|uniref:Myb/SANT-like domain-containing protein n=1 Tax=Paspalum notatum var. saurae TaxID=547442 RepID=A0AAQ3WZR5_PASNO
MPHRRATSSTTPARHTAELPPPPPRAPSPIGVASRRICGCRGSSAAPSSFLRAGTSTSASASICRRRTSDAGLRIHHLLRPPVPLPAAFSSTDPPPSPPPSPPRAVAFPASLSSSLGSGGRNSRAWCSRGDGGARLLQRSTPFSLFRPRARRSGRCPGPRLQCVAEGEGSATSGGIRPFRCRDGSQTMAPGCVNILMHYGGAFTQEEPLMYNGGEVQLFRNIDKDVMSYFHVVDLAKSVGFKDGDNLFYGIPGHSLEGSVDLLRDDASVYEMMKVAAQSNFLEVYIQHTDHDTGSNPTAGTTVHHTNATKRAGKGLLLMLEYSAMPCQGQMVYGFLVKRKRAATIKLNKRKDRRVWTAEEEKVLIDILYEMNDLGWKADTGHKNGYLSYIEKELAKRLPNAQIKADPHIQSKLKTMKKLLSYILDIQQNGSGFGWDDERKMVVGNKEEFSGWAKSRPGAAALYMKPFVNYDQLCEIYATDLANGGKAKGPGDTFEGQEEYSSENVFEASSQIEHSVGSHSQQPCHHSNPSNGSKCIGGRKRQLSEDDGMALDLSSVAKSLKTLVATETANASTMNAVQAAFIKELESQNQITERREQLFNVLDKLTEFGQDQVVKAALMIGQNEATLSLFFTTPDEYKSEFVRQVLQSAK